MMKGLAAGYEAKNLETEKVRLGDLRRGACGMAHHMLLKNATTEELVMREINHLAEQLQSKYGRHCRLHALYGWKTGVHR